MSDLEFATLLSMGYEKAYIERAIDVHRKSKYGTNWNLSILCEIIVRLQEKDEQQQLLMAAHPGPSPLSHEKSVDLDPFHHPHYSQQHLAASDHNHIDPQSHFARSVSVDDHNNNERAKPYGYHLQSDYHDGLSSDIFKPMCCRPTTALFSRRRSQR